MEGASVASLLLADTCTLHCQSQALGSLGGLTTGLSCDVSRLPSLPRVYRQASLRVCDASAQPIRGARLQTQSCTPRVSYISLLAKQQQGDKGCTRSRWKGNRHEQPINDASSPSKPGAGLPYMCLLRQSDEVGPPAWIFSQPVGHERGQRDLALEALQLLR